MSKFIIYTYQFYPLSNRQYDLYGKNLSNEELMEKKQVFFSDIISQTGDVYRHRSKKYGHKILMNQGNVIVFRIANCKKLMLEENFHKKEHPYAPSCLVVVDNRDNVQRIAIEDDQKAFGDTNVVRNIISASYKRCLEPLGLGISIQREYQKTEFWNVVNKYPEKITMIRFQLSYPNLPRLNQTIKSIIAETSKVTNSKSTTIEYKAGDGESLNIKEDDQNIQDLSKASADGGDIIKIKAKNVKRYISTGNTYKSFECEDLEASFEGDLFHDGYEKLVELLNSFQR